jgi:phosphoribosylamine--glycine ligase
MNILILGSGGREHTFAWKIAQSPLCSQLFVAPGNAGTAIIATNIAIAATDFEALARFSIDTPIDLILVGPEEPLVLGIKNYFAQRADLKHISVIGPDQAGAQLEGSKDFAKAFMQRYGIPTAQSQTFTPANLEEGMAYVRKQSLPVVLKADGLAAGKGVIIAQTHAEAETTLHDMLANQKFGKASSKVVIEEYLDGIELSVFVLTDGVNYKILPEAKDYKRIGEGDTGPNTGGMGAVSPVPFADMAFMQKVEERIIKPTVRGLQESRFDYSGFIFIGLMNVHGNPYVIEYNVRMGDPETEVVLPRIETDFVEILKATAVQQLNQLSLTISKQVATTIVLVSGGYPGNYEKGKIITGLNNISDTIVFHAGTRVNGQGEVITDGGRVLAMTSLGNTLDEALQRSKKAASETNWENKYYRRDIGVDIINYKQTV